MNWKQSLALGLCSVGVCDQKEPIAYSYNGVVLPKLPEWDRVKYPYAFITVSIFGSELFVLTEWNYYTEKIGNNSYEYMSLLCDFKCFIANEDGEWSDVTYGGEKVIFPVIKWANEDIICQGVEYTPAGAVFLSATEPVPVYE